MAQTAHGLQMLVYLMCHGLFINTGCVHALMDIVQIIRICIWQVQSLIKCDIPAINSLLLNFDPFPPSPLYNWPLTFKKRKQITIFNSRFEVEFYHKGWNIKLFTEKHLLLNVVFIMYDSIYISYASCILFLLYI